ncbi:MAG TPA: (2Fe-2S)-binding protein [Bryobacteraceae bacterium]|nr:(2Fe-2S)-binding protein [Bryobacteraceae bacterium]
MPDRVQRLNVNGKDLQVDAARNERLLWVLRDHLGLTGSKYGCGEGQCGACTVLVDNVAVRSCITLAESVVGKKIVTIEGLAQNGSLHPVQKAFLDAEAFQCGYCTSGMVMASAGLLRKNPQPSETQIKQALNGNMCRCGTYPRIVAAVRMAAGAKTEAPSGN